MDKETVEKLKKIAKGFAIGAVGAVATVGLQEVVPLLQQSGKPVALALAVAISVAANAFLKFYPQSK